MSIQRSKSQFKLEKFFAPTTPWEFLGFVGIALIITLFSGAHPLGIIGVIAIFIVWWGLEIWRSRRVSQLVFPPQPEPPEGANGLILLLSPYDPRNDDLKTPDKLKPLIKKLIDTPNEELHESDFETINLFHSNLMPQIEAVNYHQQQGKLQDVWLISSQSYEDVRGSEETAQILEKYLIFQYHQSLRVHTQGLVMKNWDYGKLWQIGEKIFRQSAYKDGKIIADITGGTKMMSVALAMACIPPKRRMQYMDSQRDWQGNPIPKGQMKPVLIDIDPIVSFSLEDV